MAFVRITKGDKKLRVPAGSLKKYQSSGWKVFGKDTKKVSEQVREPEDEAEDEVEEKSVDEMTAEELKEKAEELGLEVKPDATLGYLKKAIKKAMD